jgi:hypothetical protein
MLEAVEECEMWLTLLSTGRPYVLLSEVTKTCLDELYQIPNVIHGLANSSLTVQDADFKPVDCWGNAE